MTPAQVLAGYRRAMVVAGEDIAVRRFSGSGASRTYADTVGRGRIVAYQPEELVGAVVQGDRKVILLAETVSAILPITTGDSLVLQGRPVSIKGVDDATRRIGGTLIAVEIRVGG